MKEATHRKLLQDTTEIPAKPSNAITYTSKGRRTKWFGLKNWTLVSHDDLPEWAADNDFIIHSYRPIDGLWKPVFQSLLYLHNQSINIYSHGIAGIIFSALSLYTFCFVLYPAEAQLTDYVVWSLFFCCACICYYSSSLFHLTLCHSHRVQELGSRCDYAGIAFMIMGSFVIAVHYAFECNESAKFFYSCLACILAVPCIAVSFHSSFRTPEYRTMRMLLFAAFGSTGIIPCLHFLLLQEPNGSELHHLVNYLAAEGIVYLAGAFIFAARVPERWFPGKFDIWGHSHQYHHFTSALGGLIHWYTMILAFQGKEYGSNCGEEF